MTHQVIQCVASTTSGIGKTVKPIVLEPKTPTEVSLLQTPSPGETCQEISSMLKPNNYEKVTIYNNLVHGRGLR